MGFQLPTALAGNDGEVTADEDGLRKVAELIAGTALGAGIIGAGLWLFSRATAMAGQKKQLGDLY